MVTDGGRFLLFRQRPYPALELLPDWDVVSSLVQLSNEVKTWRNIGVAILVAFFGLALTMLNFQNNLYRELRSEDAQIHQMQDAFTSRLETLQTQLNAEGSALARLEPRVEALEKKPK